MAELIRRAGTGRFVNLFDVVWSLAEGQKGRRWREVRLVNGGVVSSLLLETFPDGRFAHLEASTAAGLVTLHPEDDGTLHGNTVTAAGIHHVVGVPWPAGSVVVLDGSPIAIAAAAWYLREAKPPRDPSGRQPIVMIDPNLRVTAASIPPDGLAHDRIDADGLPVLENGETWPLEIEHD